jgi:hypothetical protein
MKIKVTKKQLDKMILESIDDEIKKESDENFEDNENIDGVLSSPVIKGPIPFELLLSPGRFSKES